MVNLDLVFMVACGVFFYRVGQHEHGNGFVTAGISVGLWLVSAYLLGWSPGVSLLLQCGLFGAMTWRNLKRQGRM